MSAAWILLDSQVKRLELAGLPRVCQRDCLVWTPHQQYFTCLLFLPFCLWGRRRLRIERRRTCAPRESSGKPGNRKTETGLAAERSSHSQMAICWAGPATSCWEGGEEVRWGAWVRSGWGLCRQPYSGGCPRALGRLSSFRESVRRASGCPGSSVVKNLPTNAGDAGDLSSIWVGKINGEGNGNPLQYSSGKSHGQSSLAGSQRVRHNLASKQQGAGTQWESELELGCSNKAQGERDHPWLGKRDALGSHSNTNVKFKQFFFFFLNKPLK